MAKAPTNAMRLSESSISAATVKHASYSMSSARNTISVTHSGGERDLPIRCSIDVHSLKATGNEILVRSLPTEDFRMLHTAKRLISYARNLLITHSLQQAVCHHRSATSP